MMLPLAYQLFLDPMPLWDYWPWTLIPLALGVSIVYKSMKCKSMKTVPREAAAITFWILFGMISAAAVLWGIVAIVAKV
ncbi:MAG TPA: hypothetical protein VHS31_19520 [Tepidisphaeraceae bacterium]|jgi:hypothetical protein|nr:hypothetical protein [Tepidisphaeraceae bacterium]